jgi:hypothetical protein
MHILDGAAFLEQMKTIEATEDDEAILPGELASLPALTPLSR